MTTLPKSISSSTEPKAVRTAPADLSLPDTPLVVIRPRTGWLSFDLRSVWASRELMYFLTWRDVKIRYKQTALGAAWAILQPLFSMLIFTLFFGRVAGATPNNVPYPIFAYAGLLPWIFFANAITASGNSLVTNANLITKIYFPRVLIPAAAIAAGLVDLGIAFAMLAVLLVYYHLPLSWSVSILPVLVLLTTSLALAVGLWTSALNVKYRDVKYALPFFIQIWMFATPIIYPPSFVPEKWRWLLYLNPMTPIIEAFRASLFGYPIIWSQLFLDGSLIIVAAIAGLSYFSSVEPQLADVI
jgi:lipopolysaccharide transport system permease protein